MKRSAAHAVVAAAVACAAMQARAHVPDLPPGGAAVPWTFEPWVVCLLLLGAVLYAAGLRNLWRRAGARRGVSGWQAAAFAGGQAALVVALVSPIDALGTLLFSAHMVAARDPHGRGGAAARHRASAGRMDLGASGTLAPRRGPGRALGAGGDAWHLLTHPGVAWGLHGVVLWAWHMPTLFEAALASTGTHTLQHTSFFASALLFWWAPLGSASRRSQGASMFYLFTTMVHTAALGALLTLSPALWYPAYAATSLALGLDPLEDQQLGGLIM